MKTFVWPMFLLLCPFTYVLAEAPNSLSPKEKELGFELLFDGKSLAGWLHKGNWTVADDSLHCGKKGGDLTFTLKKVPDDFELRFEWKASKGCNSGVYYRPGQYEYQVLDNANSPYGLNPRQSAASLFFCMAPSKDVAKPFDQWNDAAIVCKGSVIQHFLNGVKVVDFDYTDPKWAKEVELLRIRGGNLAARGAYLRLQDHGQVVSFRSLRMRAIPAGETVTAGAFTPLPVPESELKKEAERVKQLLKGKTTK